MDNYDITDLESTVKALLRSAGVSASIYSNRPKASERKSDFVVVSVNGRVRDRAAFGECTVLIYLFARDAEGFKNGPMLKKMYEAFRTGFPATDGRYTFDTTPVLLGDIADDYGFHSRIVEIHVNIKATE